MIRNSKAIHEKYHKQTSSQKNLISPNNFTYKILLPIIDKFVKKKKPKNILDIGCGAGTLCLYYANKGFKVTGIDISEKAIKACKESAGQLGLEKKATFKVLDFQKESLKERFDLIFFTEVIEHLENDDLALKQIYKLLNPGGVVILSTPSKNAPLYKLGLLKKFDREVGHVRRYTLEELVDLCKKNNFKIIETNKTEGIVRNFLFINPIAGKSIKIINRVGGNVVTAIDNVSLKLFGESQIFVVVEKN